MLRIDLKKGNKFKTNGEYADYLQGILTSEVAGANVLVKELEQGEPIGAPVVIRIVGNDQDLLRETAEEIKVLLAGINGTVNIDDDISNEIYEYAVKIDLDQASSLGLTKYDIQKEINIALKGEKASTLRTKGKEYDILVTANIDSKEKLENFAVKSSLTGNKFLLKQVADIKLESHVPVIYKYNREKTVTVFSDVKTGFSSIDIQNKLKQQLKGIDGSEVDIVFDGEESKIKSNFGGMGEAAIFIVFFIFQFDNSTVYYYLNYPFIGNWFGFGALSFKATFIIHFSFGISKSYGNCS